MVMRGKLSPNEKKNEKEIWWAKVSAGGRKDFEEDWGVKKVLDSSGGSRWSNGGAEKVLWRNVEGCSDEAIA